MRPFNRPWLLAFLLWEAWWAYEFVAAPPPDEEMRTVFALLMGVFLPSIVLVPYFLLRLIRWRIGVVREMVRDRQPSVPPFEV